MKKYAQVPMFSKSEGSFFKLDVVAAEEKTAEYKYEKKRYRTKSVDENRLEPL